LLGVHHETQRESPKFICGVEEAYEKHTGRKINILHSDNGSEYISDPFLQLCYEESLERHFTVRKTP